MSIRFPNKRTKPYSYRFRSSVPAGMWTEASGGTTTEYVSEGLTYRAHSFNSSGTFTISVPTSVDVLVVAGGGGGGVGQLGGDQPGGGGGAGGLLYQTSQKLMSGVYRVVVGAGGIYSGTQNGGDSSFKNILTIGGGSGGDYQNGLTGHDGGSGGGSAWQYGTSRAGGVGTVGQGYDGGVNYSIYGPPSDQHLSGGGGGAGGVGQQPHIATPGMGSSHHWGGPGGAGVANSITGVSLYYAGGGGGGSEGYDGGGSGGSGVGGAGGTSDGGDAVANRGSGGGGAGHGYGASCNGGKGSDGVVIIRYVI